MNYFLEKRRNSAKIKHREGKVVAEFSKLDSIDKSKNFDQVINELNSLEDRVLELSEQQFSALMLVARIREALGDNGKRMQDELIEYCKELAKMAEQSKPKKKS